MPYALCSMPYALCPMPSAPCPLPHALCPLPYAPCSMPHALCPLPYALCPMLSALCSLPHALCPMLYAPLDTLPTIGIPFPTGNTPTRINRLKRSVNPGFVGESKRFRAKAQRREGFLENFLRSFRKIQLVTVYAIYHHLL